MPKCKICGETNFLVKRDNEYYCFKHYSQTKPVEGEINAIIEEAVKNDLIYFDRVYRKMIRRLERKRIFKRRNRRK